MNKYFTQQRQQLLSFLKENRDSQFSVEELAAHLPNKEISKSSIYRNVNRMVEEGIAGRFRAEGSHKFLYQYIGDMQCEEHLHFKCEECGQLFHMDDSATEKLVSAISSDNFIIDKKKTVLYGSCKSCRKTEEYYVE